MRVRALRSSGFGAMLTFGGLNVACSDDSASSTGTTTTSTAQTSVTSTGSDATSTAGSTAPAELSYQADVAPIFDDRCTDCHHEGVTNIPNIENPFDANYGLLVFPNTWLEKYPTTPAMNVVPGAPEQSFLMNKLSDAALEAGDNMPWSPPRLTTDEIATLRQWITDGALNDAFFSSSVRPIFGTPGLLGAPGGKCSYCHYSGALPPNLSDPFDPVDGLVGVAAAIRPYQRVVPGDPDQSLLILKVEATAPSRELGDPMPMSYPALTTAEVETVRRWIAEGAQNN